MHLTTAHAHIWGFGDQICIAGWKYKFFPTKKTRCVIKELPCTFMTKDLNFPQHDKTLSATSKSEGANLLISTELPWGSSLAWGSAKSFPYWLMEALWEPGSAQLEQNRGQQAEMLSYHLTLELPLPQSAHPSQHTGEAAMLQVQPQEHQCCATKMWHKAQEQPCWEGGRWDSSSSESILELFGSAWDDWFDCTEPNPQS